VSGGHSFVSLVAGGGFYCGLDAGGQVWCWGRGDNGQLGGTADSAVPVAVF
jgi:alpha-tubulin suppressor-like RCC1 family protein